MKILRRISAGRRRRGEASALRLILLAHVSRLCNRGRPIDGADMALVAALLRYGEGLPLSGTLSGCLLGVALTFGHAEDNNLCV